ncbi:uncharacterized protein LOC106668321 [Cimex lectularius]|uniref:Uncharacterized protein n=1 Tax=Cimex lectularius TaxID=79782 RepID=A0A8I6TFK6_CIMLE|nr:uncharacterized protein LOC106668321 [Cimex lectularius]
MENILNVTQSRRGDHPFPSEEMGTCFRNIGRIDIEEDSRIQERAEGFFRSQRVPSAFNALKDNYKYVNVAGASSPEDYFFECPWDNTMPMRRMSERVSDIKLYPRSRHAIGYEYNDCYNDRLAMKKVVRTKPMSFFVVGPSMVAPCPLAKRLAEKYGAVLIEPRSLVKEYFKNIHSTKNIEYDILEDNTVVSSENAHVPARVLGELIIRKLKSYAVYKRGYVLTGIQYCKYATPDNVFSVLNKVFSARFAPDVVIYVEATIPDLESIYEDYSVYPMYPYEMVQNFTNTGNDEFEARRKEYKKDPRDEIWHKLGKSLSFEESLVLEVLQVNRITFCFAVSNNLAF